jgi:gamma-glutamylcyclotransferase (GGCT)/AIG2-like uncharacterized protein YtfP
MKNVVQLFVYGSLRSGFKSDAYHYVSKYFKLIGNATAKGILYDMGNFPVATATTSEKFIVGELYEILDSNAFDFVIAQIDDYEGLYSEDHEAALYKRDLTNIFINETTTKAWVYWYCGSVNDKPIVESGDVLEYFRQKNKG